MASTVPRVGVGRLIAYCGMCSVIGVLFGACATRPDPDEAEEHDPDYVGRYVREGPPNVEPLVELLDHTTFPPRLRAEAATDTPDIRPSRFDVTEAQLENARRLALADRRVQSLLGERFVEITIGAGPLEKDESERRPDVPPISIEWFSYTNELAVRATVAGRQIVDVQELPSAYQPPETEVEIEEAARIVAADRQLGPLIRGAEVDGILSVCDGTVRCLFVRFVDPDGVVVVAAEVDMIGRRILEHDLDPDSDIR